MKTITASHVADVNKPITSRSAADRASKTRTTLCTAQMILVASGDLATAQAINSTVRTLNQRIRDYYQDASATA